MSPLRETDLYPPIKRFLEGQGYVVKAEVRHCDVVAVRGDESPVVIELKTAFSLPLVLQGIDRQAMTDAVYVAVPLPSARQSSLWGRHRRRILQLCRRLGLGLMTVKFHKKRGPSVEVHVDPAPYVPRKNARRRAMLLKEFEHRVGDVNAGGSTRRPVVTAYRQDALRCAKFLHGRDSARLREIREQADVERAAGILQRDVYGWFRRVKRGTYCLSPRGLTALNDFSEVVQKLT